MKIDDSLTKCVTIVDRLIYLIEKHFRCSKSSFAKKAGIEISNFSKMLKNQQPITDKTIVKLCNTYKINEEWLRTGEGVMLKSDVTGNNNAVGNDASVNINESETISNLISVIKKEQEQKDRMLSIIEDLTSKIK